VFASKKLNISSKVLKKGGEFVKRNKIAQLTSLLIILTSVMVPYVFSVVPEWTLYNADPPEYEWDIVHVDHWKDSTLLGGDRHFEWQYQMAGNFGKWNTDIQFQSGGPHADEEIFYQYYHFLFSGTSKNTGDPVEFGWWIEYSKWYEGPYWTHRMKGYRRDQNGNDLHLWTGEAAYNFRCYLETYIDQSPDHWWTTCKFTVEGNELINSVFDYIETPLFKRMYDQSWTAHTNWIEGWSTNGEIIQGYDVAVGHSGSGTVYPMEGTWRKPGGTSMQFTAEPYSGYYFHHWILDGQNAGSQNPYTHYFDGSHTLTAVFYKETGGGCPTLFVWSGTHYADEGVLDIHAESDITVQREIENTLTLRNWVYNLELRELDNFTSHIDQVKLYAVDSDGEWHLSPLIYAYHSDLGRVTWKLRFDDSIRVDLEPTEAISLKFLPSIPYNQTAYFVFEINGYNRKIFPK
jgi:hypothetical protein